MNNWSAALRPWLVTTEDYWFSTWHIDSQIMGKSEMLWSYISFMFQSMSYVWCFHVDIKTDRRRTGTRLGELSLSTQRKREKSEKKLALQASMCSTSCAKQFGVFTPSVWFVWAGVSNAFQTWHNISGPKVCPLPGALQHNLFRVNINHHEEMSTKSCKLAKWT